MTKGRVAVAIILAVLLGGGALFGTGALLVLISVGMGPSTPQACDPNPAAPVSVALGQVPKIADYNDDQIRNATTIDRVREQLGLPPRATQIAFMTAMVEGPNLLNPQSGDRDSQGMFQQRPSTGWGTPAQITDPVLATRAFFGEAGHTSNPGVADIPDWQTRPMGEVAQAVQRSAFPARYGARQDEAAALMRRIGVADPVGDEAAAALGGPEGCRDPAAFGAVGSCPATPWPNLENPPELGQPIPPDALRTLRCGHQQFPQFTTAHTYGKRAVASDEHGTGRAIDWMVPGGHTNAAGKATATQMANWLVANQKALGVRYVIWNNKIWNVERDPKDARFPTGWRPYVTCNPPRGSVASCGATGAHLDHVHVTVWGDRGVVDTGTTVTDSTWSLPVQDNYLLGPGVCAKSTVCWGYGGHTGQDFDVYPDAPVVAVAGGTVTTTKVICPKLTNRQRAGNESCSYGRYVVIDHGGGIESYYAHLNAFAPALRVGTRVRSGQLVGREGSQGHSSGPHLHLEIRRKGAVINPIPYFEAHGVTVRCGSRMKGSYGPVPSGRCS